MGEFSPVQNFKQKFVYLFQVKNQDESVVSISWVQGEIAPNQTLDISQSWIPKESGIHNIETFVWNSLIKSNPLSQSTSKSIFVES